MLADAIALQAAPVGRAHRPMAASVSPPKPLKKDAVTKAYAKIIAEHSGSTEAYIAEYTLAARTSTPGKSTTPAKISGRGRPRQRQLRVAGETGAGSARLRPEQEQPKRRRC